MDGYIKNKKEAIKSVRKTIFGKYSITFLIISLIPVWLFVLLISQPPEKWTHKEIVFSHISQERIALQRWRSYVLNAEDGSQFVINSRFVDVDALSDYLVSGNTYHLVFSNTIAGGDHMEALSDGNMIIQDLESSIDQWEWEQQEAIMAIIVTLIIEIVALILIDRLWCKKEYAQIRKLKADIQRRRRRIEGAEP